MNKWFACILSIFVIGSIVYAQGLGGREVVPGVVPGQEPNVRPGVMRGLGSGASVAASDRYVYVLRGDTLMQLSVEGLKVVSQTRLPSAVGDFRGGEGGGRRDRNAQPPSVD